MNSEKNEFYEDLFEKKDENGVKSEDIHAQEKSNKEEKKITIQTMVLIMQIQI